MIYCISDIHGDYGRFSRLLKKLGYTDKDTLYILGNIIGGGDGSMELLLDIMMRTSVFPVIGEHEYIALRCMKWLMENRDAKGLEGMDDAVRDSMMKWMSLGGSFEIEAFRKLDEEHQEMIVEYISDFPLYEEARSGGKEFVLVHAGLNNFSPDKELDDYEIRDIVTQPADYSKIYFENKYLVTGHTPTRRIFEEDDPFSEPVPDGEPSRSDRIYIGNNHIAVNCGCDIGGRLGAVRLDDFAEFYVD